MDCQHGHTLLSRGFDQALLTHHVGMVAKTKVSIDYG
jgi:hypothetical protein